MADVGPDEELTLTQIEEMTNELALQLKNSIQNVDRKFEQLNHTIDHHHDKSIVSEFLKLKNDQMLHQREFDQMETLKFKVSEKLGLNKSMFMLVKREMHRLKKEEENLNQKMIHTLGYEDLQVVQSQESSNTVRGEFGDDLEGFKKEEENAISRNEELENKCSIDYLKEDDNINPNTDTILSSFSRKLKLIKHFYLAKSLRNQVKSEASTSNDSGIQQLKFNWIRDGKDGKFEEEVAIGSKDFRVRNKDELELKIQGLLEERQEAMEKDRSEGKMSFLQWADHAMISSIFTEITRTTLVSIQDKVTEILNQICVQMCELMFVSAKNFRQFRQWTNFKHIFMLLMVLQEPGETVYLGKIVSMLEAAQHTLERAKQYKLGKELEGMSSEIDLLFDLFLREVLCLESILTYPIFSPVFDEDTLLVNVGKSLDECMKQVKEFGYSTAKDGDSLVPSMTILVNREIDRLMKAQRNLNRKLSIMRSISTEDGRDLQVIQSQESTSESAGVKEGDHDGSTEDGRDLQVIQSQESTSESAGVKEDDHDGSTEDGRDLQVIQSQESRSESAGVKQDDHDFDEEVMKEEEDLNALDGSSSNTDSKVVQSHESTSERADVKDDDHYHDEGFKEVDLSALSGSSLNTDSQVGYSQESSLRAERTDGKDDDLRAANSSSSSKDSQAVQQQESMIERAISPKGGGNLGEESVHLSLTTTTKQFQSSLSRKLKLIKYYYLANDTKFNWLREEKDVKFEMECGADSEEFRVRNKIEMEKRIAELIEQRQNAISRAQTEGNMSFMKWHERAKILRKRINQITAKKASWIYLIGMHLYDVLMAQIGALMFTSETFGQLRKWIEFKYILLLLMLLQQDDETILFKRTIEFMEVTQAQVEMKILQQQPRHGGESEDLEVMNTKIDEFVELILRELLCLESIVSYPILYPIHANSKLDAISKGFEERKKQMSEIKNKVNEFKSTARDLAMWIRSKNFFNKTYRLFN